MAGMFASVGWRVTLCDPIDAFPRSGEMGWHIINCYTLLLLQKSFRQCMDYIIFTMVNYSYLNVNDKA
jgi:hypothetical protein